VPTEVLAALRQVHEEAGARNALLLHDLARVQTVLAEAGVPSVALKGTALVAAYYPAIGARHVGDIDLLVAPAQLARAAAVLAVAGVHPAPALPPLGADAPRAPGSDHLAGRETWSGFLLELHDRAPGGGPAAEEILAASRLVEWHGHALRIPSPIDLAGIACVHAIAKHRTDWRLRARHVADLGALEAGGPLGWDAVRARYGGGAGADAIRDSLALVEAAHREAAGAGPQARRLGFLGPPPLPHRAVAEARAMADALGAAWREAGPSSALRIVFPTRRYLEARFGVRPGSPLTPLLLPWRLARGAVRRVLGR
jgi:hypothetical protein